jgi:hypothetical protein
LVNELERKLRKLLYLAASISDNENAKENVKQLEEKDFSEIFDLLFIDQNFILDMKKRINAEVKSQFNGRSKYTKDEIKLYLDSVEEHALWDTILLKEDVPTLRSRFRDVQTYRNDVMHAHNIDKEQFEKARYLFDKVNKELDSAIDRLLQKKKIEQLKNTPTVSAAIKSTMQAQELSTISDIVQSLALIFNQKEDISGLLSVTHDLVEVVRTASANQIPSTLERLQQQVQDITRLLTDNLPHRGTDKQGL